MRKSLCVLILHVVVSLHLRGSDNGSVLINVHDDIFKTRALVSACDVLDLGFSGAAIAERFEGICRRRQKVGGGGSVCAATVYFGRCRDLSKKLLTVMGNGTYEGISVVPRAASVG